MDRLPRVLRRRVLHETKWLRLQELWYKDQRDVERPYISVERPTRPAGADTDAVVVLPLLITSADPVAVLIRQFRPPLDQWILELPAGLIDAGESVETAVHREIKEETGYDVSEIVSVGPPIANDPGLTNGNCRFVVARVRADDEGQPAQMLEETEAIEVLHVPLQSLLETLHERQNLHGDAIDARLYSFALGRQLSL
ncbi:ADP-sugar pyrophosphatase [Achlya hypogyna]|uniref:ADP-sugar pyrophosphatase n=1 Tax=Achlya hypogyna TaxID=1202772 RepID=A0A1V9YZM9_ACHHY|nr:ADP-sugar pyrophosphatase [Achlya hypogyna]